MTLTGSNNPYGDNTEMVARLIGTAYDTVKIVRDNLTYIKHVSVNLESVALVSTNMTALLAVYTELAAIVGVNNSLPQITAVFAKLTEITAVYANLDNIQELVDNLPALLELLENVPVILQAVADAEAARDAAEQYAQDAFENANNLPFATEAEHIAGVSTTKAVNPAGMKAAFDSWDEDVSLLNDAKSFAGIAGNNQTYNLDIAPNNVQDLMVHIGGAIQRPTTDFTVAGTVLTILANPDGLAVDTLVLSVVN